MKWLLSSDKCYRCIHTYMYSMLSSPNCQPTSCGFVCSIDKIYHRCSCHFRYHQIHTIQTIFGVFQKWILLCHWLNVRKYYLIWFCSFISVVGCPCRSFNMSATFLHWDASHQCKTILIFLEINYKLPCLQSIY